MSYVVPTATPVRRRTSNGRSRTRSIAMLVVFLLISAAAGALGLLASTGSTLGWYPRTPRVSWAPPVGVLTTVRAGMFLLLAVAEWFVWSRRRDRRVRTALGLFVAMQAVTTVWPVLFFAGYGVLGLADLWICVGVLLVLDALAAATAVAFWPVSRVAGSIVVLHLLLCLLSTALVLGSAGMHAVL